MMTIKTPEVMTGSEGKPDYFVVARKGGVWLGIKMFCGLVPQVGPAVGCKLRSAWAPNTGAEAPTRSKSLLHDPLTETWADLPFDRMDETRASATWVLRLLKDSFPAVRQEIIDRAMAAKFAARLVDAVGSGAELLHTPDALADLIAEAWCGVLDAMTAEGADIVPLPAVAIGPGEVPKDMPNAGSEEPGRSDQKPDGKDGQSGPPGTKPDNPTDPKEDGTPR